MLGVTPEAQSAAQLTARMKEEADMVRQLEYAATTPASLAPTEIREYISGIPDLAPKRQSQMISYVASATKSLRAKGIEPTLSQVQQAIDMTLDPQFLWLIGWTGAGSAEAMENALSHVMGREIDTPSKIVTPSYVPDPTRAEGQPMANPRGSMGLGQFR
jgi:hypothetical protein